jgi:hypothetical protein
MRHLSMVQHQYSLREILLYVVMYATDRMADSSDYFILESNSGSHRHAIMQWRAGHYSRELRKLKRCFRTVAY